MTIHVHGQYIWGSAEIVHTVYKCLGNHEFDLGVAPLKRFLDVVTFPVVSANLDITSEPRLQGHVSKRHVVTVDNEQIGIVGYITPETKFISRPGPSVAFTEIADAVREQVAILQGQGVNKIIALGHAGYPTDQLVAEIEGVDIVVGGHTDTFLYSGTPPVSDEPKGAYPTVVTQDGGKQALVVQAYTWGKYLGYLNVTFSDAGDVVGYTGNPILLNASVEEDPTLLQELWTWNGAVEGLLMDPIGYSSVLLDGERLHCRLRECNLGNLITDSIIEYHVNYTHAAGAWAPAAIALVNSGGVRSSIDKGVVTKGEIIAAQPFGNEIDLIRVAGHDLRLQLEHAVNNYNFDDLQGAFLQMSGLKVIYNLNRPAWERVVSVEVRCLECDVPSYSPLDDNMEYNVLINTFLVEGGDGFTFSPIQQQRFNTLDSDTLTEYLRRHNPVYAGEEGRISFDTSGLPDPVSSAVTITTGVTQCLLLLLAVVLCWLS